MAILNKGTDYSSGDQVTSSNLDNHVDGASFVPGASGSTDDSSLEVNGSGRLQVKDGGVSAGKLGPSSVVTEKLANSSSTTTGVTFPKIRYMKDLSVIGNVSGASSAPTEVDILDEDDMSSDSATSLATQQSIKAYIDNGGGFGGRVTGGESVSLPNGLIMKFGTVTVVKDSTATVTFDTAFPNEFVQGQATLATAFNTNSDAGVAIYNGTPTSMDVQSGAPNDEDVQWMAIGY